MRCPVCKAENAEELTCRRCKADLSPLINLEQARRSAVGQAVRAVAKGDGTGALQHAEIAHRLRADRETWRLLALACLLQRDFARAMPCRQRADVG